MIITEKKQYQAAFKHKSHCFPVNFKCKNTFEGMHWSEWQWWGNWVMTVCFGRSHGRAVREQDIRLNLETNFDSEIDASCQSWWDLINSQQMPVLDSSDLQRVHIVCPPQKPFFSDYPACLNVSLVWHTSFTQMSSYFSLEKPERFHQPEEGVTSESDQSQGNSGQ